MGDSWDRENRTQRSTGSETLHRVSTMCVAIYTPHHLSGGREPLQREDQARRSPGAGTPVGRCLRIAGTAREPNGHGNVGRKIKRFRCARGGARITNATVRSVGDGEPCRYQMSSAAFSFFWYEKGERLCTRVGRRTLFVVPPPPPPCCRQRLTVSTVVLCWRLTRMSSSLIVPGFQYLEVGDAVVRKDGMQVVERKMTHMWRNKRACFAEVSTAVGLLGSVGRLRFTR